MHRSPWGIRRYMRPRASSRSRGLASGHDGRTCPATEKHVFYGTSQLALEGGRRDFFLSAPSWGRTALLNLEANRDGTAWARQASSLHSLTPSMARGSVEKRDVWRGEVASGTGKEASGTNRHLQRPLIGTVLQYTFFGSEIGSPLSINVQEDTE